MILGIFDFDYASSSWPIIDQEPLLPDNFTFYTYPFLLLFKGMRIMKATWLKKNLLLLPKQNQIIFTFCEENFRAQL